jgi:hypothetical protein
MYPRGVVGPDHGELPTGSGGAGQRRAAASPSQSKEPSLAAGQQKSYHKISISFFLQFFHIIFGLHFLQILSQNVFLKNFPFSFLIFFCKLIY